MPMTINTTMVITLSRLNQYSTYYTFMSMLKICVERGRGLSYFTIGANGNDVGKNEKEPEYQTQRPPGKIICPVLKNQLERDEI